MTTVAMNAIPRASAASLRRCFCIATFPSRPVELVRISEVMRRIMAVTASQRPMSDIESGKCRFIGLSFFEFDGGLDCFCVGCDAYGLDGGLFARGFGYCACYGAREWVAEECDAFEVWVEIQVFVD